MTMPHLGRAAGVGAGVRQTRDAQPGIPVPPGMTTGVLGRAGGVQAAQGLNRQLQLAAGDAQGMALATGNGAIPFLPPSGSTAIGYGAVMHRDPTTGAAQELWYDHGQGAWVNFQQHPEYQRQQALGAGPAPVAPEAGLGATPPDGGLQMPQAPVDAAPVRHSPGPNVLDDDVGKLGWKYVEGSGWRDPNAPGPQAAGPTGGGWSEGIAPGTRDPREEELAHSFYEQLGGQIPREARGGLIRRYGRGGRVGRYAGGGPLDQGASDPPVTDPMMGMGAPPPVPGAETAPAVVGEGEIGPGNYRLELIIPPEAQKLVTYAEGPQKADLPLGSFVDPVPSHLEDEARQTFAPHVSIPLAPQGQDYVDQGGNRYRQGGLVHLADGGQFGGSYGVAPKQVPTVPGSNISPWAGLAEPRYPGNINVLLGWDQAQQDRYDQYLKASGYLGGVDSLRQRLLSAAPGATTAGTFA